MGRTFVSVGGKVGPERVIHSRYGAGYRERARFIGFLQRFFCKGHSTATQVGSLRLKVGSTNLRHVFGVAEKVDKVSFGQVEGVGGNHIGAGVEIIHMNLPNYIRCVFDAMLSPTDAAAHQLSTYSTIHDEMAVIAENFLDS